MSERHTSLRPIGLPRALGVRTDGDGMPLAVARSRAHGQYGAESRVESIEEMWRISEAWWREAAQTRTYFHVLLNGGRPLSIYRDDVTGAWFEQPYSEPRHPGTRHDGAGR